MATREEVEGILWRSERFWQLVESGVQEFETDDLTEILLESDEYLGALVSRTEQTEQGEQFNRDDLERILTPEVLRSSIWCAVEAKRQAVELFGTLYSDKVKINRAKKLLISVPTRWRVTIGVSVIAPTFLPLLLITAFSMSLLDRFFFLPLIIFFAGGWVAFLILVPVTNLWKTDAVTRTGNIFLKVFDGIISTANDLCDSEQFAAHLAVIYGREPGEQEALVHMVGIVSKMVTRVAREEYGVSGEE